MQPDSSAAISSTVQQIELMRREIQASVLDTMMTVNQRFLDRQIKQDDFALAHEIARVIKDGLSLAENVMFQLRLNADTRPLKPAAPTATEE